MKNPFKKSNKAFTNFFKKVGDSANKTFSKSNMADFRDRLGGVLKQQGDILANVGAGLGAVSPLVSLVAPEVGLPLMALGLLSAGTGGLELQGSNLLDPKYLKSKSTGDIALDTLKNVSKGVINISKASKK